MELEKIRGLIGRYFAGETSEEEEMMLRDYLGSPSAPASLVEEFGYLAGRPEKVPEPSEQFEAMLDGVTRREVRLAPGSSRRMKYTGIGAAITAAAGLWLIFSLVRAPHARDTFNDPAIAMAEVKSILLNVSERMNTGTVQLEEVSAITAKPEELNSLSTINSIIGRNLSRLRYLDELQPAENKTGTE